MLLRFVYVLAARDVELELFFSLSPVDIPEFISSITLCDCRWERLAMSGHSEKKMFSLCAYERERKRVRVREKESEREREWEWERRKNLILRLRLQELRVLLLLNEMRILLDVEFMNPWKFAPFLQCRESIFFKTIAYLPYISTDFGFPTAITFLTRSDWPHLFFWAFPAKLNQN